jgi:integrase
VPPQKVDTAVATAALHKLPADKTASFRNAVRFFDRLIAAPARHAAIASLLPKTPVGPLPTRRDAPIDWSRFPADFLACRDAALDRAVELEANRKQARAARIAARRQGKRLRRRRVFNPEAARKTYLRALSWLARHAEEDRADVHGARTLAELMTEDRVEAAAERYMARSRSEDGLRDAAQTSSLKSYLSALVSLARRTDMDESLIFALEDIAEDPHYVSDRSDKMSATREAFVRLLDRDPAIIRAIVTGPETLLHEARRGFDRWDRLGDAAQAEALHLSIAAASMAVQLARPLRTRNVNEFEVEGPGADLLAPQRAGAQAWIEIDRGKVKNRRPIEGPVPDWLWRVIESWQAEGRPRWIARHEQSGCVEDGALFPGTRGGYLSRTTFNKCWNRGMARLGLTGLTPHMMRHVAATLYLAVHPGDYPVVAALLCDELKTVETFYARGEGRAAAELFAQVLEDLHPTLKLGRAA